MSEDKKPTFGQISREHFDKYIGQDLEDHVREYTRPWGKDIMVDVKKTVDDALTRDIYRNRNFYVDVRTATDKFTGAPLSWTMARLSCPSAVYEQTVFKYYTDSKSLEFLWHIPRRSRYWHIRKFPQRYLQDSNWAQIAKFVLLMESGELLDWIIKENGEKPDGAIVMKSKEEDNG